MSKKYLYIDENPATDFDGKFVILRTSTGTILYNTRFSESSGETSGTVDPEPGGEVDEWNNQTPAKNQIFYTTNDGEAVSADNFGDWVNNNFVSDEKVEFTNSDNETLSYRVLTVSLSDDQISDDCSIETIKVPSDSKVTEVYFSGFYRDIDTGGIWWGNPDIKAVMITHYSDNDYVISVSGVIYDGGSSLDSVSCIKSTLRCYLDGKSYEVPANIASINNDAFHNVYSQEGSKVYLKTSIDIGANAFLNDNENIYWPEIFFKFDDGPFLTLNTVDWIKGSCPYTLGLGGVYIHGNVLNYYKTLLSNAKCMFYNQNDEDTSIVYYWDNNENAYGQYLGDSAIIEANLSTIFADKSNIKTFALPSTTTSITGSMDAKGLRYLVIPDSVTSIGDKAFIFSENTIDFNTGRDYYIGTGVTSLGDQAFASDDVFYSGSFMPYYSDINIRYHFAGTTVPTCDDNGSIGLPLRHATGQIGSISDEANVIFVPQDSWMEYQQGLKGYLNTAQVISDNYWTEDKKTDNNTISWTNSEWGAFENMWKIPFRIFAAWHGNDSSTSFACDHLDSIPTNCCADSAFSSMTSITIPATITTIGANAFSGCTTLATFNFRGTMEQWNAVTKTDGWNTNAPFTEVVCSDGTVTL